MLDETTRENLLDWAKNYIGQQSKANNLKVAKGKGYDCDKLIKIYHLVELIEEGHEEPTLDNLYRRLQCLIGLHVREPWVCTLGATDIQLTNTLSGNNIEFDVLGLSGAFGLVQYSWVYDMSKFELPNFETAQRQNLFLNVKDKSQGFTTTMHITITDDAGCEHIIEKEFTFEAYCSIEAEEIIFTDTETGNDLQFTIDELEGVGPFTYQWSFENENLELKSGTNTTSSSLFLNVIDKTQEFTAEVSVVITESTGCTTELTKTISFSTYCSLEISGVQGVPSQVPVDTDIYVFIDRTSLSGPDITTLRNTVNAWFENLQNTINYQGSLYMIETYSERWLQYASFPRQGILTNFNSESAYPNTVNINSILPSGLSFTDIIGSQARILKDNTFVPSDKAIVLAFVDESANAYHNSQISYGQSGNPPHPTSQQNIAQPTPQYMRDLKGFELGGIYYGGYTFDETQNLLVAPTAKNSARELEYFKGIEQLYSQYEFFKMLVYPIVDAGKLSTKSLLLQALASIKSALYLPGETAIIPYNNGFTPEVGGEWDTMLNLLKTTNPYIGLTPLEDFNIEVKTNKSSPASAVFTPEILGEDLQEFFDAKFVEKVTLFVSYSGNIGSVSINWTVDTDIFTVEKTENGGIFLDINTPQEDIDTNITVEVTDSGGCVSEYEFKYQLVYNEDETFTQTITPL